MTLATLTRLSRPTNRLAGRSCSHLQAMREGEMRTRAQHARVGAAFTKAIARRMSTCMAPNYLAALGPGGEQTPSQDTQKQLEKERCFGENSPSAVQMGIESQFHFVTMRGETHRPSRARRNEVVCDYPSEHLTNVRKRPKSAPQWCAKVVCGKVKGHRAAPQHVL